MRVAVLTVAALVAAGCPAAGAHVRIAGANAAVAYTELHIMRSRFDTPFRYLCAGALGDRTHSALPDRRSGREQPAFAPDGRRVAYVRKAVGAGGLFGTLAMYALSSGQELAVFASPVTAAWPAWFPTNDRLAFSSTGGPEFVGNIDIYAASNTGEALTRLTTGAGEDTMPAISPDGSRIAYVYAVGSRSELWVMNADGTGHIPLVTGLENVANPSWSPDGRSIVFAGSPHRRELQVGLDGYRVNADGTGLGRLSSIGGESDPEYSPDGTLVAFVRGTSIWTRRLETGAEQIVVSAQNGLAQPTWQPLTDASVAPVGRELCAIKGSAADEVIDGTAGDDVIFGGPGSDRIRAFAGDDLVSDDGGGVIEAGPGEDKVIVDRGHGLVFAGAGNDRVLAMGPGRVTAFGQLGNDSLHGGDEGDRLDGGEGRDSVLGRRGNDRLGGGSGVDLLVGGAGRDVLAAGGGDDVLLGYGLDPASRLADMRDALRGGAGRDYLAGGRGQDLLQGESGDDVLISRDGFADRVLGGLGFDRAWIDFRDLLRGVEACPKRSAPPAPPSHAALDSRAASPSPRCRPRR